MARFGQRTATVACLVVLLASGLPFGSARIVAQDAPTPDLAGQLPVGVRLEILSGGVVDAATLRAPPASVVLERVVVQPGEGTALQPASGVEILFVESGALSIIDELGIEGTYPAGSQLFVNPGLVFSYANTGGEPVSLLRVSLRAAGAEPSPAPATPTGRPMATPVAASEALLPPGELVAVPVAAWPEGPVYLFLGSAVWEPGAELPAHTFAGPVGLVGVAGELTVAGPSGIEGQLRPGRAVAFPAMVENRQRNAGTEAATVLMAGVAPVDVAWVSDLGQPLALSGSPEAQMETTEPGTVPMFHGNAARTGVMPGPGPEGAPIVRWSFQTGPVRGAPAVANGIVYVGTAAAFYALDAATGEVVWEDDQVRQVASSSTVSSPSVEDGQVIIGGGDNAIHALDAATGAEQWAHQTGNDVTSSPATVDGVVYVGSTDRSVYALDAATGAERWTFETGGIVNRAPAVADGTVFVDREEDVLHALESSDGSERWRFATSGEITSSPAVADGAVYVGTIRGVLHAVDVATGGERWRFESPSGDGNGLIRSTPAISNDTVFVGIAKSAGAGAIHALDAATGAERWRFESPQGFSSSPAIVAGVVFIGGENGVLYALDAATGAERWRLELGEPIRSSPAVVDGAVYVGSVGGLFYAIGGTEGALAVTPTPVPLAEGATAVVSVAGAVLRAAPSAAGVVIGELPEGTAVDVVGPSEEREGKVWWRVEAEGIGSGYVEADALTSAGG